MWLGKPSKQAKLGTSATSISAGDHLSSLKTHQQLRMCRSEPLCPASLVLLVLLAEKISLSVWCGLPSTFYDTVNARADTFHIADHDIDAAAQAEQFNVAFTSTTRPAITGSLVALQQPRPRPVRILFVTVRGQKSGFLHVVTTPATLHVLRDIIIPNHVGTIIFRPDLLTFSPPCRLDNNSTCDVQGASARARRLFTRVSGLPR
jgi:hypothetical protein